MGTTSGTDGQVISTLSDSRYHIYKSSEEPNGSYRWVYPPIPRDNWALLHEATELMGFGDNGPDPLFILPDGSGLGDQQDGAYISHAILALSLGLLEDADFTEYKHYEKVLQDDWVRCCSSLWGSVSISFMVGELNERTAKLIDNALFKSKIEKGKKFRELIIEDLGSEKTYHVGFESYMKHDFSLQRSTMNFSRLMCEEVESDEPPEEGKVIRELSNPEYKIVQDPAPEGWGPYRRYPHIVPPIDREDYALLEEGVKELCAGPSSQDTPCFLLPGGRVLGDLQETIHQKLADQLGLIDLSEFGFCVETDRGYRDILQRDWVRCGNNGESYRELWFMVNVINAGTAKLIDDWVFKWVIERGRKFGVIYIEDIGWGGDTYRISLENYMKHDFSVQRSTMNFTREVCEEAVPHPDQPTDKNVGDVLGELSNSQYKIMRDDDRGYPYIEPPIPRDDYELLQEGAAKLKCPTDDTFPLFLLPGNHYLGDINIPRMYHQRLADALGIINGERYAFNVDSRAGYRDLLKEDWVRSCVTHWTSELSFMVNNINTETSKLIDDFVFENTVERGKKFIGLMIEDIGTNKYFAISFREYMKNDFSLYKTTRGFMKTICESGYSQRNTRIISEDHSAEREELFYQAPDSEENMDQPMPDDDDDMDIEEPGKGEVVGHLSDAKYKLVAYPESAIVEWPRVEPPLPRNGPADYPLIKEAVRLVGSNNDQLQPQFLFPGGERIGSLAGCLYHQQLADALGWVDLVEVSGFLESEDYYRKILRTDSVRCCTAPNFGMPSFAVNHINYKTAKLIDDFMFSAALERGFKFRALLVEDIGTYQYFHISFDHYFANDCSIAKATNGFKSTMGESVRAKGGKCPSPFPKDGEGPFNKWARKQKKLHLSAGAPNQFGETAAYWLAVAPGTGLLTDYKRRFPTIAERDAFLEQIQEQEGFVRIVGLTADQEEEFEVMRKHLHEDENDFEEDRTDADVPEEGEEEPERGEEEETEGEEEEPEVVEGPAIVTVAIDGDEGGSFAKMLSTVQKMADEGHSFSIVVDPEGEGAEERVFYLDGDGAFKIHELSVEPAEYPEEGGEEVPDSGEEGEGPDYGEEEADGEEEYRRARKDVEGR